MGLQGYSLEREGGQENSIYLVSPDMHTLISLLMQTRFCFAADSTELETFSASSGATQPAGSRLHPGPRPLRPQSWKSFYCHTLPPHTFTCGFLEVKGVPSPLS